MRSIRKISLVLAIVCVLMSSYSVFAAEVDCDATYCFTPADFSENENLKGICITALPDVQTGTVLSMRKVSTASCADYNVRFPQPFDEGTEPHVVVGFLTNSTAARFGACTCAVLEGSVNNEGFTIRFYNGDTSSRMPHFSYIAFGVVTK